MEGRTAVDPALLLDALGGHLRSLADLLEGKGCDQSLKDGNSLSGLIDLVQEVQATQHLPKTADLSTPTRSQETLEGTVSQLRDGMLVTHHSPQGILSPRNMMSKALADSQAPDPVYVSLESESPGRRSDARIESLIQWHTVCDLSNSTNIVEIMSGYSSVFAVAFFLGGFSVFRNQRAQMCYDSVFVASFAMCFCGCLSNLFWQTPPFYDLGMDMVTVMFHCVGVQTWLFWRRFTNDPMLENFVRSFLDAEPDTSPILQQLSSNMRMMAVAVLVYELLLVGVGWYCFVGPSWIFGASHSHQAESDVAFGHGSHTFASMHALLMWVAIPSHVPTMVSGHAFLVFINRLHTLDVWRALELLALSKTSTEDEARNILKHATDLADASQTRLDFSCAQWQCWWLSLLFFTLLQLLAVTMHIGEAVRDGFWHFTSRPLLWHVAYDVWHGTLGIVALISLLIGPSRVSFTFSLIPRKFLLALRAVGSSFNESFCVGMYLQIRCRGFTVADHQVTFAWVVKFVSAIAVGMPLYVTLVHHAHKLLPIVPVEGSQ